MGCIVDCCLLPRAICWLLFSGRESGGRLFFVWMNQISALSVAAVTILSRSSSEGLRLGRVEEESKASPVIFITWRDLCSPREKNGVRARERLSSDQCAIPGIGNERRKRTEMRWAEKIGGCYVIWLVCVNGWQTAVGALRAGGMVARARQQRWRWRSSGGSNCSATTVAMTLTGGGRRTESWSASAQDGEGTIERAAGSLCARKCGCCGCGLRFASWGWESWLDRQKIVYDRKIACVSNVSQSRNMWLAILTIKINRGINLSI
jgi:hypothetical protein